MQRLALSFLVIVGLGQVTLEEGHAPKIMIASRLSLPIVSFGRAQEDGTAELPDPRLLLAGPRVAPNISPTLP